MNKITIYMLVFCFIPLLLTAQQKNDNFIRSLVKTQIGKEFSAKEASALQLKVNSSHQSSQSKIEHFYFRQTVNNLEVLGTESSLHLMPDGKIFRFNNQLTAEITTNTKHSTIPTLNPIQAVKAAGRHLWYPDPGNIEVLEHSALTNRSQKLSKGKLSRRDIPIKLVYYSTNKRDLILAWDLSIYETRKEEWWSLRVDAQTGEILEKESWMVHCRNTTENEKGHSCTKPHSHVEKAVKKASFVGGYRVFDLPIENPLDGSRTLQTDPDDATASPFGWHDTDGAIGAEFTIARGNNVHAFDGGNNFGYSPDGGTELIFDFPLDITQDPNLFEDAGITNIFYWGNKIHDILYHYGFDEASGNFQENNYGNGGLANDYLDIKVQTANYCNGGFGTPVDGENPIMVMYICEGRDGAFNNTTTVHEYGHGLTKRLTGGAAVSSCLQNEEQMGEGWSDFLALTFTTEPTDSETDTRAYGDWFYGQPNGIRPYPYNTDMTINPATYDSIKAFSPPHEIGSVWATMLWEMNWLFINQYGFDEDLINGNGGNSRALTVVVEGLKLQPCSPGFVDGRDAILAADVALNNGANQCLIWQAFAKRGLGFSADQGGAFSKYDGVEAFDMPESCDCETDLALSGVEINTITQRAENTITSTQTIEPTGAVVYKAGTSICLQPGFWAKPGCDFIAQLEECSGNMVGIPPISTTSFRNAPYTYNAREEIEKDNWKTPEGVTLEITPNPFQETTTISYILEADTEITITITDISGKVIDQPLVNSLKTKGTHHLDFNGRALGPGLYFCTLNSGSQVITKQLVIAR